MPGQDNLVKRRLPHPPYYEIASPIEVLRGLRDRFEGVENGGFYFTMIYAVLNGETGDLEWVSAGHPPPILLGSEGCGRFAKQCSQTPIGLPIEPHGEAVSNRATLAPGERVFFYSDGLVELRDREGQWLPEDWLEETIAQAAPLPIAACVARVIERLRECSGPQEDDITLVGLERRREQAWSGGEGVRLV